MKKNIIYLIIFIVLLAVAGWLLTERNKDTSISLEGRERYSFSIKDTSEIDKIIISDKDPTRVVLSRVDNNWMVNGKYKAREDAVATLLETLYRMEMRNFIQERMQQTVIRRMAVYGKEVQVYKNGEPYKVFYVGTEAPDEMATYMMLKGSDQPFAVYIPGFNGFLSSRFFTEEHLWRSMEIFDINPGSIKSVSMHYPDSAESSFRIRVFSRDSVYVEDLNGDQIVRPIDRAKVNLFLSAFKNLSYEGLIIPSDPIYARRDSLKASEPVFELNLKDNDGNTRTLTGYLVRAPFEPIDQGSEIPEFDPDNMHGFVDGEQMVLLQYYGLRHILKPKSHFRGG